MKTISVLSLMAAMFLGLIIQPVCGQDTLKIDTGPLKISIVSVEIGESFPAYVGSGPATFKPYMPFMNGRMSLIFTVGDHAYSAGEVKASNDTVIIKVECVIQNVSESVQSFQIGDISMTYKNSQVDFMAVSRGKYLFAKNEADREIVKKEESKIESNTR